MQDDSWIHVSSFIRIKGKKLNLWLLTIFNELLVKKNQNSKIQVVSEVFFMNSLNSFLLFVLSD